MCVHLKFDIRTYCFKDIITVKTLYSYFSVLHRVTFYHCIKLQCVNGSSFMKGYKKYSSGSWNSRKMIIHTYIHCRKNHTWTIVTTINLYWVRFSPPRITITYIVYYFSPMKESTGPPVLRSPTSVLSACYHEVMKLLCGGGGSWTKVARKPF